MFSLLLLDVDFDPTSFLYPFCRKVWKSIILVSGLLTFITYLILSWKILRLKYVRLS